MAADGEICVKYAAFLAFPSAGRYFSAHYIHYLTGRVWVGSELTNHRAGLQYLTNHWFTVYQSFSMVDQ